MLNREAPCSTSPGSTRRSRRSVPDRECIVFRDRRLSWADVTDRTRRLADVLRRAGLGCHRERAALAELGVGPGPRRALPAQRQRVPRGHARRVQGALRARQRELPLRRRGARLPVRELRGRARSSTTRASRPRSRGSARSSRDVRAVAPGRRRVGRAAAARRARLRGRARGRRRPPRRTDLSPDDLYVLYTGGTTGMPKGVLWRQDDIFLAALLSRGRRDAPRRWSRRAQRAEIRALPAPPFMHGAAHWIAFNTWFVGGTIVVQSHPERLDPADIWSTVERERVTALTIVGDAFARPLVDELERRGRRERAVEHLYDVVARLLTSGGAILSAALKRELLELLPRRAASSTRSARRRAARQASTVRRRREQRRDRPLRARATARSCSATTSRVGRTGQRRASAGSRAAARVPLGYLGDPEKTAKTFPVIDGVRYAVPGDRAMLEADGRLRLLGRDSVTINTGGEKVFAEEVEQALKHHPAVYDAVVVGTPHERWGQQVIARGAAAPRRRLRPTRRCSRSRAPHRRVQAPQALRVRRRDPALAERQGRLPLGEGSGSLVGRIRAEGP